MQHKTPEIEVVIGDGSVTLRRRGSTSCVVANILGMDRDADGNPVTIWLDRLAHRPKEDQFIGWSVSGAISSVLTRT